MNDKLVGVCESQFGFSPTVLVENAAALEEIDQVTESERKLLGYTVEKVTINSDGTDYFVEYTGNLEKYMKDQALGLHEAVENICEEHELLKDSIVIVVDESCVDKIDMVALKEGYNVKRI